MHSNVQPLDESRPVVLRRRDVNKLRGIPGLLRRKKFGQQADVLEQVLSAWDGAQGFVVVHEAAIRLGREESDG